MWISRKKYDALVARVTALEKAVNMRAFGDGGIQSCPFMLDGLEKPSINEVVAELAQRAGIAYDFGKKPGIVAKKK
jgi:hypothetical protein